MNVKQTAKKITAVVTGAALFTGLTVGGAAALDLSDYPEPFIMDGAFNGKLVVGEVASSQDIVGAIDIAASLQAQAREGAGTGTGTGAIEGGYEFDEGLNNAFPETNLTLDDRDLAGLQDRTIRWDGNNIRIHEEVVVVSEELDAKTSVDSDIDSEDYATDTYLNVERDAVHYRYIFDDDDINASEVDTDNPLTISFLGQELEITDISDGEMTLESSRSVTLGEGDTFEVGSSTITVRGITESVVRIDVDGELKNIEVGESFDFAADIVVEVEGAWAPEAGDPSNEADLKIGEELSQDVYSDESLGPSFGEPEEDADAEWLWDISVDSDVINYIGAYNDIGRTEVDVRYDDERPALGIGDSMSLPNDYATVTFEGFFDTASNTIDMEFRGASRLTGHTSDEREAAPGHKYLSIRSDSDRDPFRFGDIRTNELYILGINSTGDGLHVGYRDDGTSYMYTNVSDEPISVKHVGISLARGQEDEVMIKPEYNLTGNEAYYLVFEFDTETLTFKMNGSNDGGDVWEHFGTEEREAYQGDLVYNGSDELDFYNWDHSVKLTYGVSFDDPESQLESDRFTFTLPHEKAEAIVTVTTPQSQRGAVSGDAYVINPLGTGIAILDRDASVGSEPYIVVGGPRANTVAASLLGNPGNEEINEMFGPGLAMVKLFADQNALLVAGWEAQDTVGASYVLANFEDYDLSGDEVEIVTADETNLQVREPTQPAAAEVEEEEEADEEVEYEE